MRVTLAAMTLSLVPAIAMADGFHTRDLGAGGSPQDCMTRARQAVDAYARQSGTPNATINEGAWSVQGFDLMPGYVDIQIACPYRDNQSLIVLLVSHSSGNNDDRITVVDGITDQWNAYTPGGRPAVK